MNPLSSNDTIFMYCSNKPGVVVLGGTLCGLNGTCVTIVALWARGTVFLSNQTSLVAIGTCERTK